MHTYDRLRGEIHGRVTSISRTGLSMTARHRLFVLVRRFEKHRTDYRRQTSKMSRMIPRAWSVQLVIIGTLLMYQVRLLLYSNEIDIEGLVAVTSTWIRSVSLRLPGPRHLTLVQKASPPRFHQKSDPRLR